MPSIDLIKPSLRSDETAQTIALLLYRRKCASGQSRAAPAYGTDACVDYDRGSASKTDARVDCDGVTLETYDVICASQSRPPLYYTILNNTINDCCIYKLRML